jgi:hypothetical protein
MRGSIVTASLPLETTAEMSWMISPSVDVHQREENVVRSGLAVFACDGFTQCIRVVLVDAIHGGEEGDH